MDWISPRPNEVATGPTELIGREPEIQQLRLFVSRITQGAGQVLLLSGDPGVGKTSLLDLAAAIATDSGIRLLRATGSQFEADISFAALHQLLRPCLVELPHLSPLAARALNVALCLGEGPPPPQLLVATAVLELLQQVAKEQPLLLIVDDLPWLDRASTGRWDEAQRQVDEGLQLCDTHGYDLLTWPGRLTAALLAAARGDLAKATDTATDMDAWATPRRAGIIGAYASHIRGLTALGQGDFETAFGNAAAISPPGVFAPYAPHALWVFLDLVEAAIHTGRRAEAAAHVAAARDGRLDRLSPRLRLIVLAGEAITEPRTGTDPQTLEQMITEPGHDRWPFDLARIQLSYGSPLRRSKRTTDARRHLAAAAETFRRLGATPWAARADRELRATGVTVAAAATGLASLTPQQRQIALLAAAGHTNKGIAARLFLSPRTVSTHLYQVFPKLGITSRAALRDALADTPPD